MMATLFGNVQEYDSEKEEWSQYAERLEHFFLASKVEDAERKRAILLSVMGPACYRLLRSLVAPVKPSEKTYKELVDALKEHHEPMPSEIVQRCKLKYRADHLHMHNGVEFLHSCPYIVFRISCRIDMDDCACDFQYAMTEEVICLAIGVPGTPLVQYFHCSTHMHIYTMHAFL